LDLVKALATNDNIVPITVGTMLSRQVRES
jgi:hypothetical protein